MEKEGKYHHQYCITEKILGRKIYIIAIFIFPQLLGSFLWIFEAPASHTKIYTYMYFLCIFIQKERKTTFISMASKGGPTKTTMVTFVQQVERTALHTSLIGQPGKLNIRCLTVAYYLAISNFAAGHSQTGLLTKWQIIEARSALLPVADYIERKR